MGIVMSIISTLFIKFFGKKQTRVLMIGFDGAYKTTILYKLKLGKVITTNPIKSFKLDKLEYNNISFIICDLEYHTTNKQLWKHCYRNIQGIIFFIDSNDRDRLDETQEELRKLMAQNELNDAVLLILANKQSFPNAMFVAEIVDKLKLTTHHTHRLWHIQETTALSEHSFYKGLEWLTNELKHNKSV